MLSHIFIKDLVIVRQLSLDFGPGMTALTGETGAGKSILIDALGLALGDKSDNGMIRQGADKAEVTASFDLSQLPDALAWLEERELASGDECILRRVLVREGRSRSFINGSPSNRQLLAELGEKLIAIHGQHAHQALMKRAAQRRLLDAYAGHTDLLQRLSGEYEQLRQSRKALAELQANARDQAERQEYLRFQLREFDELSLQEGELEDLEEEHGRLAHADRLGGETAQLVELLSEADQAAQPILSRCMTILGQLTEFDPSLKEAQELIDSARIQVDEAASQLRHYTASVDLDPERLAEIDERLGRAHGLARKHRIPPEKLPAHHQQLQAELERLGDLDQAELRLADALAAADAKYRKIAKTLSASRAKAAKQLASTVTESMQTVGMAGGSFAIGLSPLPDDEIAVHGVDQVEFTVAANPGQSQAPLAKVASGGELSRISLAIQVATAGCGEIPSLIFDEVDVGIGGAVAEIVGQLLRRLGESRQIFCVTHLPQVASQAHQHLRVSKHSDGKATETEIQVLDQQGRIAEIARMLGGVDITQQTLAHADEMIARASSA